MLFTCLIGENNTARNDEIERSGHDNLIEDLGLNKPIADGSIKSDKVAKNINSNHSANNSNQWPNTNNNNQNNTVSISKYTVLILKYKYDSLI